MPSELEKILSVDDKSKSEQALKEAEAKKAEAELAQKNKDEEVAKKEEHLANLNRAISEANEQLKKARAAKKTENVEEELPKINFEDPSAKAWDHHISEKVRPAYSELEKEKEEIRTFALQEFLADKPALAKSPDKVKQLVATYERIRTASERTREGVLLDLNRAYAAENHEQLFAIAKNNRRAKAEEDALFSEAAVSRGATAYSSEKETLPTLSEDDRRQLARWGYDTPEKVQEYLSDRKKYGR